MFLSLTLHGEPGIPARDLGFILHKHPDRVHTAQLSFGTAQVFYPRADDDVCQAALWVDVDTGKLAKLGQFRRDSFHLSGYINDRPWAASSLLAVALRSVFSTAMAGTLASRPDLAATEFRLEAQVAAVQTTPQAATEVFAPLGWEVTTASGPEGPAPNLHLHGRATVQALLNELYVLIPVLDGGKHYWVDESEIDKLLDRAGTWLAAHPQRETILHRYLAQQRRYVRAAEQRLDSVPADPGAEAAAASDPGAEAGGASRQALRELRRERVLAEITALRPRSVVDIGCGAGALLAPLLGNPRIASVIGTDVSAGELSRAERALNIDRMPERQAARLELIQSSITYIDERIAEADVAVLMEVIEHIDPSRLPAVEASLFGHAAPSHAIVTTPNREYNACYPGLAGGQFRHPDHRFEFSRAEFASWAAAVCSRYGYVVDIDGIGDADPVHGQPTQIAVFSRTFTAEEPVNAVEPAA